MALNREILCFALLTILGACQNNRRGENAGKEFAGSESCIECHERFYKLWSPSFHGKAMQPVTKGFLAEYTLPKSGNFEIEGKTYSTGIKDSALVLFETDKNKVTDYPVSWALGGKNVFYFLTPLEKGKLQTIPLAFDLNKKAWYNNPQSAVRHFSEGTPDKALPWKDRMYTFNTSCYSCHVSQLSANYNLSGDSYQTTWKEPGINCETCHGPSSGHIAVCRKAKVGEIPKDLKIISTKSFSPGQHNASCAPCHAKMHPITASYTPGERYFDNYDLTTIENPDFYPDGRDLGENYTMTSWELNECAENSAMHCVACHTSSGRFKFKNEPEKSCLPCHSDKVENVAEHSQHPAGTEGAVCINCHLPKTEFGRMIRSDHSFRPPMPEATIRFGSPNACNSCHSDKSPQWANEIVKKRENKNYQDKTIEWAQLLKEARGGDWKNSGKIFSVIEKGGLDEVVITSFVRLMPACPDSAKWKLILKTAKNKSPLVRSAVASVLADNQSNDSRKVLASSCSDEYRLVRVNAAASLAGKSSGLFSPEENEAIRKATEEYKTSLLSRPDDWSAHYNLGLFYQNQGDIEKAIESYQTAAGIYPESVLPLVNSSLLLSATGNQTAAEQNLKQVLQSDPGNEAANLNLGLLLAELGRTDEARKALETVIKVNPKQAVAAYNLCVLAAPDDLNLAVGYAKIAAESSPGEPKYAYTLAFYLNQSGKTDLAIQALEKCIRDFPEYLDPVYLLADIYIRQGNRAAASTLYGKALKNTGIPENEKARINQLLSRLNN